MFFSPLVTVSDTLTCLMPSNTRAQQHRLRVMNLLDHPSATRRLLCMSCSMAARARTAVAIITDLCQPISWLLRVVGCARPQFVYILRGQSPKQSSNPRLLLDKLSRTGAKSGPAFRKNGRHRPGHCQPLAATPATNTIFTLLIPTRQPWYVAFGNFDEALKPDIFPKLRLSPQYVLLPGHEPPSPPSLRASTYSSPK